jgi:hypothetical protein
MSPVRPRKGNAARRCHSTAIAWLPFARTACPADLHMRKISRARLRSLGCRLRGEDVGQVTRVRSPRLRRMAAAAPPDQRRQARPDRGPGHLPAARCPVLGAAGAGRAESVRGGRYPRTRRTRCPGGAHPPAAPDRPPGQRRPDRPRDRRPALPLLLSPRTVSSHLYRSYPKLGVASRHQLRDVIAAPAHESAGSRTLR